MHDGNIDDKLICENMGNTLHYPHAIFCLMTLSSSHIA